MDSINTEALVAILEAIPEGAVVAIQLEHDLTCEDKAKLHALETKLHGFTFLILGPQASIERLTDVPERELREHLLRARREPSVQDMAAKLLEQFVIARRPELHRCK